MGRKARKVMHSSIHGIQSEKWEDTQLMKITITERARELYASSFPVSTSKCDSLEDLDYKIQRMIDLGKKKKSGDTYLIHYHKHQLQVIDNKLVNIQKTKNEYVVSERLKRIHYNKIFKVMV